MKKALAVILVLIVVGGGGFLLAKNDSDKSDNSAAKTETSTPAETADTQSTNSSSADQSAAATITYSDSGFSPSSITVKSGDKVTIKNTSSRNMQFDSDPHPAHTDNSELNVETVEPGSSQTFTVKRTGNFGYHNHLNPSDTGTIIVE